MSRGFWFIISFVLGLLLLALGWLMPVYLRAIDPAVLQKAGKRTTSLIETGFDLISQKRLGAAELLVAAGREQQMPTTEQLAIAVTNAAAQHPGWKLWGGGEAHLEILFATAVESRPKVAGPKDDSSTNAVEAPLRPGILPLTEWVVRIENRGTGLELLKTSRQPIVRELMACRELTNTTIFPPSTSSAGQALDAALSVCGLLAEEGQFSGAFSNAVYELAQEANQGKPEHLEQVLLDLMSLGQRLNWGQMVVFINNIETPAALKDLTDVVRKNEASLPSVFAAVVLSQNPRRVAEYTREFNKSGLTDLGESLRYGSGGVNELLRRQQRLYTSGARRQAGTLAPVRAWQSFVMDYCWRAPTTGLVFKWLLYALAGFFIATAFHFAWPKPLALEEPLQVRGVHIAREILFALGFLLAVLLVSEPFLAQDSQRVETPLRLRLPTVGSAVTAPAAPAAKSTLMNNLSLLTLLLFFVLQGLLYFACLVKLAEIRRQRVSARIKLRLLDNEDHLFDAGLYLGFVGTIISLILVSLGVIKPSLMAAYSSTSFGIIFVSIFKIFHLRPEKRRLVLESEIPDKAPLAASPLVVPS
jgi:hypothetical protein